MERTGVLSLIRYGIHTIGEGLRLYAPPNLLLLPSHELGETNKFTFRTTGRQKPQTMRERFQQVQADIHQAEGQIRGSRIQHEKLVELGDDTATTLSTVIVLCLQIWTKTRNDAVDLREYLEAGARNVVCIALKFLLKGLCVG